MNLRRDLSREAHLWYTITSPAYTDHAFGYLKEAYDILLSCVSGHPFIGDYPPVPYWGGVVKDLLDQYPNARKMLEAGDFSGMIAFEGGLGRVPRGFDESNMTWMGSNADLFMKKLDRAAGIAGDFWSAVEMSQMFRAEGYRDGTKDWHVCIPADMGIASYGILLHYEAPIYGLIGRPTHIPEYAADTSVTCKTGDIVPWTGVWVPSTGMGTAALAFARQGIQIMQPAYELAREFAEDEYLEATKVVDTTWHPVKPASRMIPLPPATGAEGTDLAASAGSESGRCEAHHPCPREGFWFTPAKAGSRRFFKQGELMPAFKSDYGMTIWQWDQDQSA
jgi:hypothetical protein